MPSVTRTIHFEKTQERYELTASPACVHLDGGGNQTETVTVRLMHYKGKESDEITGKYVTITDGANSANFTLPAEINQSGSNVISQSLDDREHGAPDSLTVIGILGANNLVIPVVHDGADGENAVTVQTSPEAILHKKATTSSQYSLAIRVWNGKTAVPASGFSAKIQSKPNGLSEYMIASATDSYINYLGISINANTEINGDITIAVTYNGNTYTKVVPFKTVVNGDPGEKGDKGDKGDTGEKGDKGDRGAVLRGPQAWADIGNGYVFQAGGDNDEWKDVVLYNGNYYSCLKGHTKTASNYPTSTEDTNNGYWKLGDKIELVATKILLATYALVKNLGVEAIDMKDSSGDVIFQAKDGNVVCNSGTFKNITVKGNSTFEGAVKAKMFYGTVKKVTPGDTYQIDPVNEPYNFYYVENPVKRTLIVLPKAADYEGLEINIFTKLSSSSSLDYRTIVKAQANDDLYVKQNAVLVSSDVAVEKINVEYTNFKNDGITTTSNAYIRFKCIGGAWYAISGQFTGE